MAGLLDLIQARRQKFADGGVPVPMNNLAGKLQLANQEAQHAQSVEQGAFSTTPDALPRYDAATMSQPSARTQANLPTPDETAVEHSGFLPRVVQAGTLDVGAGVQNALAAAAQAVGADNVSASLRQRAGEASAAAEKLTPDQIKDTNDIHSAGDAVDYAAGQFGRSLPAMGAMALGGGLAKSAGMSSLAGIAAPSAVMNVGGSYAAEHGAVDQQEQAGQITPEKAAQLRATIPQHAAAAGAIGAALDTLTFGYVLKANPIAKAQLEGIVSKTLGGHFMKSIVATGVDATAREAVNQVATKAVLENPDLFHLTDEDKHQLLQAAASNTAAMAPFAIPGHLQNKVGVPLGKGVDAVLDTAGKLINKVRPGEEAAPGAPVEPAPSFGTKMGNFAAAVADTDAARLKEYGGQAVETLKGIPGVEAAMKQGTDFVDALGSSRRLAKVGEFVSENAAAAKTGFDSFVEAAKAAYGDKVDTSNLEGAFERYKSVLGHSLSAEGVDSATLGKMTGEKFASFVSGVNDKLPMTESVVGSIFNTAKGVAGEAADKVTDAATSFAKGYGERSFHATPEETRSGMQELAATAKAPDEPNVKKSQAVPLSYDATLIRSALMEAAPKAERNDATLLAKRLTELLTTSPKKFEEFTNKPEVAAHLATTFDMTPDIFREHLLQKLRGDPKSNLRDELAAKAPDRMEEHKVLDKNDTSIDGQPAEHGEGMLNDEDYNQAVHALDEVNQTGERHPGMSADMLDKFATTGSKKEAGGNAWVNVTRTTKDPATGETIGTATTPKQVNFMNVSKHWAPQREISERAQEKGGERTQQKFDNNFTDGLSAMLGGWHEVDEKGNPVEVSVQPAKQHTENGQVTAVDRADMAGWLRPDSVVGKNGKPRTFADVEKAGKANQPVDLPGQIDKYHSDVVAARRRGGPDMEENIRSAADKVVRMGVERIKDNLDNLEPQRQSDVIQAAIDYASDPTQRPIPKDVPSMLRMMPDEVLRDGKARLISELSDLDAKVAQPRLKGEQETSFDNPEHNSDLTSAEQMRDSDKKTDLSGSYVGDYAAAQAAGKAARARGEEIAPASKTRAAEPGLGVERRVAMKNESSEDRFDQGGGMNARLDEATPRQPAGEGAQQPGTFSTLPGDRVAEGLRSKNHVSADPGDPYAADRGKLGTQPNNARSVVKARREETASKKA